MPKCNKKRYALCAAVCLSVCAAVCLSVVSVCAARSREVTAVRSPADLWTVGDSVTLQSNADLPSYMTEGYISENSEYRYVTADDFEDWQKNGVLFTVDNADDTVTYNNVIDLNGFTKEDRLIDIIPYSSNRIIDLNYTGLDITFTDADNPNIWFTLQLFSYPLNDFSVSNPFAVVSHLKVKTNSGIDTAFRYGREEAYTLEQEIARMHPYNGMEFGVGGFHNAVHPRGYNSSTGQQVAGLSVRDMQVMPFSLRYDAAEKQVWIMREDHRLYLALDLDQTEVVGQGREFAGFTEGRVKMSIQLKGILRNPASFYVLNVANHGMNGAAVVDREKPSVCSPRDDENLPKADIGTVYPFYDDVEFYDFYDGVLPYEVRVKSPDGDAFGEPVTSFTPTEEGWYTLLYSATDSSGNRAEKEYRVFAQYAVEAVRIDVDTTALPQNVCVGETVPLPPAEFSGGSGQLKTDVRVTRLCDGKTVAVENGAFVPQLTSDYAVQYTAVDFLGRTANASVIVAVGDTPKPIFASDFFFYEKLVDGESVRLPQPAVYDYHSTAGQRRNAVLEITARGVGDKANVVQRLENGIFTPTAETFGDTVEIVYKAYCTAYPEAAVERVFPVHIVKPDYLWDYFVVQNATVGYNAADERDNYVSFTATEQGDVTIGFINSIPANGFAVQFETPDFVEGSFEAMEIELVDYENADSRVLLTVSYIDDTQSYVEYKGVRHVVTGGFGGGAGNLQYLQMQAEKILDYTRNEVCDLGGAFFPSGRLWATVRLKNAAPETVLRLITFGSQSLRAIYRGGALQKFSYTVAPSLTVADFDNVVSAGERFVVPAATAYDMFSLYVEATYTLTAPSGRVLAKDKPATGLDGYVLDEYGEYVLRYTVSNNGGRRRTVPYSVFVFDRQAPHIRYTGATEMTVSANSAVSFETVTVVDSVDPAPQYLLFVIDEYGMYRNITASHSYTFTRAGVYTVRYYAFDASDNSVMLDVRVTVQ